jgi:phage repressor protein C with HTH and peptisase S24 domain
MYVMGIKDVRTSKGLTLDDVAARLGSTPATISRLENGRQTVSMKWLRRLAELYGCSVVDLVADDEAAGNARAGSVPLVGYVGAGQKYYPDPAAGDWGNAEWIEAPPGVAGVVAVKVVGDSMLPVYYPGDILYFRKEDSLNPLCLSGRDCVVQVLNGPAYIKRIKRITDGFYRLESYNSETSEQVQVEWAAPVLWVRRGS